MESFEIRQGSARCAGCAREECFLKGDFGCSLVSGKRSGLSFWWGGEKGCLTAAGRVCICLGIDLEVKSHVYLQWQKKKERENKAHRRWRCVKWTFVTEFSQTQGNRATGRV